ncbi:MAG TPA: hypothetical protein VE596_19030 [Gaiellaceae bacterium]|nr:hypothetical protein [Gaiellaceae bacterium]
MVSGPPTISSVGASTRSSGTSGQVGRPPRDTTTRTARGRSAAAINAAAAPGTGAEVAVDVDRADGDPDGGRRRAHSAGGWVSGT